MLFSSLILVYLKLHHTGMTYPGGSGQVLSSSTGDASMFYGMWYPMTVDQPQSFEDSIDNDINFMESERWIDWQTALVTVGHVQCTCRIHIKSISLSIVVGLQSTEAAMISCMQRSRRQYITVVVIGKLPLSLCHCATTARCHCDHCCAGVAAHRCTMLSLLLLSLPHCTRMQRCRFESAEGYCAERLDVTGEMCHLDAQQ